MSHAGPPLDVASFEAILFDMDGTLVDSEPAWFAAERALAAVHGVHLPDDAEDILHGLDAHGLMVALRERYGLRADPETFLRTLAASVGEHLREAAARPGAAELVRAVAAAERPCAVVSNSPHAAIRATLAPHPWSAAVPVRVSADDVPRGKPEPDVYHHAAGVLGVRIGGCLAIEDSTAGVTAAVRAGAACVAITHGERPASDFLSLTPHVIASLTELPLPRATP